MNENRLQRIAEDEARGSRNGNCRGDETASQRQLKLELPLNIVRPVGVREKIRWILPVLSTDEFGNSPQHQAHACFHILRSAQSPAAPTSLQGLIRPPAMMEPVLSCHYT